jgi:single-strand DNA-binding protein
MSGVNKVILIGNLGADPEIKNLESGSKVANVNIATTESYKDKDGNRKDITEWHRLEMWDGLAGIAEKYCKKGDRIYVEGKLRTETWQDKDGNNRYTTKVRVQNLMLLSPPPAGQSSKAAESTANLSMVNEADDLPF